MAEGSRTNKKGNFTISLLCPQSSKGPKAALFPLHCTTLATRLVFNRHCCVLLFFFFFFLPSWACRGFVKKIATPHQAAGLWLGCDQKKQMIYAPREKGAPCWHKAQVKILKAKYSLGRRRSEARE